MTTQFDFEKLTIRQLFVELLGEKDAEIIIKTIREAIEKKFSAEELNEAIQTELSKMKGPRAESSESILIVQKISPIIVLNEKNI